MISRMYHHVRPRGRLVLCCLYSMRIMVPFSKYSSLR